MTNNTTSGGSSTTGTTQQSGFFAHVAFVQHVAPWGTRAHYGHCNDGCMAFMTGPRLPARPDPQVELAAALAVLGLPAEAPIDTLHRRYRELAREHHPDVGGEEAKMKRINAAYDVAWRLISG